jgi:molybdopterin synthase sulfur carrier subunit
MTNTAKSIKLMYFAWVREKVGRSEEFVEPPGDVSTVADLLGWLRGRGPEYAAAFERADVIRTAIDHTHARHSAPIASAREIAFFPPVTGG